MVGTNQLRFLVKIKFDWEQPEEWWSDKERVEWLMEAIESSGFPFDFEEYELPDKDGYAKPYKKTKRTQRLLVKNTTVLFKGPTPWTALGITRWAGPVDINLQFSAETVGPAMDCLRLFLEKLQKDRSEEATLRAYQGVIATPAQKTITPSYKPPRSHSLLDPTAIVDVVTHTKASHDFEAIRDAPLPPGVSREIFEGGECVALRWLPSDATAEDWRAHVIKRQRWIAEQLTTKISVPKNSNALGDQCEFYVGTCPKEHLLQHNPQTGMGWRTAEMDGESLSSRFVDECRDWLEKGEDPSGLSLKAVGIVVPTREAALSVRKQAQAEGFVRILYPCGELHMDPFPPGDWLE